MIGTITGPVAVEAYQETGSERSRTVAEQMFKALTDTFSDQRGVRRPTMVQELGAICEVPESDVIQVIEVFRRPGRCFLAPLANVPLDSRSIIDISHESLMRCWTRLIGWAEEERVSAGFYRRLSQASAWFEEGTAGLWRDPELELGLQWKERNRPTPAWAERYGSAFTRALEFLDRSEKERDRILAERERERKRQLQQFQWAAAILATSLVIAGASAYLARKENARAEENLQLAQDAVNQMLSSAGRQQARVAEDVPEMETFRKELLVKARAFYSSFVKQKPDSERIRNEMAEAHFRLGDINRLLQQPGDAAQEYRQAISQFASLVASPGNPRYRQALANSYNWLGETLRTRPDTRPEAEQAYESALHLQQELVHTSPENAQYQEELTRTHYNRGILRYEVGHLDSSDSDFREAIRLLQPLAEKKPDSAAAQELARVCNNLGTLLRQENRLPEARDFYERGIRVDEALTKREPGNREYKEELAIFENDLALLLLDQRRFGMAQQGNRQALDTFEELARPPLSLGIELAKAQNLRCQLLESQGSHEAEAECQQSLDILDLLAKIPAAHERPEFHMLFRDLGYNYLDLAKNSLASGSGAEAPHALQNLSHLLPEISEPDRSTLSKSLRELQQTSHGRKLRHSERGGRTARRK